MSARLPYINGSAPSPHYSIQEAPFESEANMTKFEQSVDRLTTLGYPQVNSDASVKHRIQTLENITSIQSVFNKTSHDSFVNLSADLSGTDQNLKELILQMQNSFDAKLATLKKEYDHRFELQSSENKRLQNHVSTLKADTVQLKRKLQSTAEKLKKLQLEFGDDLDDGLLEEESAFAMSITGGGFSPNNSRPATTNF